MQLLTKVTKRVWSRFEVTFQFRVGHYLRSNFIVARACDRRSTNCLPYLLVYQPAAY